MEEKKEVESTEIDLFDICWEDILIEYLTPHLTIRDIFALRCCSKAGKAFGDFVISKLKVVDLGGFSSRNMEDGFKVYRDNCSMVQYLNLEKCYWLTDYQFLPFLRNNRQLETVILDGCVNITSRSFQLIITMCKQLKNLSVAKCPWITTGAIEALTLHQYHIVKCDFSHCSGLSEKSLLNFFRKFNKLESIVVSNNSSITDKVLKQISVHCKDVDHLDLSKCSAVSHAGVEAVVKGCKELKSISIYKCPMVHRGFVYST